MLDLMLTKEGEEIFYDMFMEIVNAPHFELKRGTERYMTLFFYFVKGKHSILDFVSLTTSDLLHFVGVGTSNIHEYNELQHKLIMRYDIKRPKFEVEPNPEYRGC